MAKYTVRFLMVERHVSKMKIGTHRRSSEGSLFTAGLTISFRAEIPFSVYQNGASRRGLPAPHAFANTAGSSSAMVHPLPPVTKKKNWPASNTVITNFGCGFTVSKALIIDYTFLDSTTQLPHGVRPVALIEPLHFAAGSFAATP
jgi:hypothetical protein